MHCTVHHAKYSLHTSQPPVHHLLYRFPELPLPLPRLPVLAEAPRPAAVAALPPATATLAPPPARPCPGCPAADDAQRPAAAAAASSDATFAWATASNALCTLADHTTRTQQETLQESRASTRAHRVITKRGRVTVPVLARPGMRTRPLSASGIVMCRFVVAPTVAMKSVNGD